MTLNYGFYKYQLKQLLIRKCPFGLFSATAAQMHVASSLAQHEYISSALSSPNISMCYVNTRACFYISKRSECRPHAIHFPHRFLFSTLDSLSMMNDKSMSTNVRAAPPQSAERV